MPPQTAPQRRRPQTRPCPNLVLGLGNILLRDEGVGVRVVQAMERMALPPDVEAFDGGTAGLDLLDVLADRRKVVIIDAADGEGAAGSIYRFVPADLAARCRPGVSLHEVGLLEALTAARQLGAAPQEVVIIGVKPAEVSWGLDLSPEVARLVPRLIALVRAELESCAA